VIDLYEFELDIERQESRKIANVALVDFGAINEIIGRLKNAEAKLAEMEKELPSYTVLETIEKLREASDPSARDPLEILAELRSDVTQKRIGDIHIGGEITEEFKNLNGDA